MKREMKIRYLMHILLVLLVLLTLVSCTKTQKTIEETLAENNIDFDKISDREQIDNRAIAFYKGKKDPQLKMGLFELRKNGWHFLIENKIDKELTGS
ncbi:MAG: hypothetical protein P4L49_14935 [Desulfosporosinus sp.]|nr:hypothetical protein [Desulfosporosinus sp.]